MTSPRTDVYSGKAFPLAPLFTTASIVPSDANRAVEEIDASTAQATLNALEKAVRSFEAKSKLPVPTKTNKGLLSRFLFQAGWILFRVLMFVSLTIAAAILLKRSRDRCAPRGRGARG